MRSTIKALFKNKEDADDAVNELKTLGVDNVRVAIEKGSISVEADFWGATGVRNVFEKRNAYEIKESMPERK